MDSFSKDYEESWFFDALENIPQETGFIRDTNREYDMWIGTPQSVEERRRTFISKMGFSIENDIDRIIENSGAVHGTSSIEDEFSSSRSFVSSWNTDDLGFSRVVNLSDFTNVDVDSNSRSECNVDGMVENNGIRKNLEFENVSQFSPREIEFNGNMARTRTRMRLRDRFLSKLCSVTCVMSPNEKNGNVGLNQVRGTRIRRVRVRYSRRKSKELSAVFTRQDIQAHEGSILTMKFNLDGQYLASAGEDKIVRVWQVVEDERSDKIDIPDADPSCVYFSVNNLSELGPFIVEKDDKINESKNLRKTPDSACIIFPPKVFRVIEKPLHEFQGHNGEILDLSWSKDDCLVSSSVDKTVRLWRIGVNNCLKVFYHSDYVTCIQFNPVNDDSFISGSIDGKIRIWSINGCQVVDWTETRDIITAVSYHPDGQGGIIGSLTGTYRFFNISDNHIQLEKQLCLTSKKKSPCKRITGFEFLPQDPSKVLVTCADSQVRIIDGTDVIGKYKGLRNAGNQTFAKFTSDGKHIISASEDSNVYIWNYANQEKSSFSHQKPNRSFEFFSSDASTAIPWPGFKSHESLINPLHFSSSTCFALSQEFLDSNTKGTATWPEEKLPESKSLMGKSHYKFLKNSCQSFMNSHAWGMVIVTAGWDGRIRSFHNYGLPVPL